MWRILVVCEEGMMWEKVVMLCVMGGEVWRREEIVFVGCFLCIDNVDFLFYGLFCGGFSFLW